MKRGEYFLLYSFCPLVKGQNEVIVFDTIRNRCIYVPEFFEVLHNELSRAYTVKEIIEEHKEYEDELNRLLSYLIEEGFGFLTNEPEQYPRLEYKRSSPEVIKSAIIEIEDPNHVNYFELFSDLEKLQCANLELWIHNSQLCVFMEMILKKFHSSKIKNFTILVDATSMSIEEEDIWRSLTDKYLKVGSIVFYNSDKEQTFSKKHFYKTKLDLYNMNFSNEPYSKMIMNQDFFIESQFCNPFFYKRVNIDKVGNIKNFFAFKNHFGNVNYDKLSEVVLSEKFQSLWYITNDHILEIKDSAFRYCYAIMGELIESSIPGIYQLKNSPDSFPWQLEATVPQRAINKKNE